MAKSYPPIIASHFHKKTAWHNNKFRLLLEFRALKLAFVSFVAFIIKVLHF